MTWIYLNVFSPSAGSLAQNFSTYGLMSISWLNAERCCVCRYQYASAILISLAMSASGLLQITYSIR